MKAQRLFLMPSEQDEKRWVAEITGEDKVFRVKRDFQPKSARDSGIFMMDGIKFMVLLMALVHLQRNMSM